MLIICLKYDSNKLTPRSWVYDTLNLTAGVDEFAGVFAVYENSQIRSLTTRRFALYGLITSWEEQHQMIMYSMIILFFFILL